MCRFENILVGLDLARKHDLVADRLSPYSKQAFDSAVELARAFSSKLVLVYVLEISTHTQRLIESEYLRKNTVFHKAKNKLKSLAQRARDKGIETEARVFYGRSWEQLIRQVPRGKHDLVVIGARQLGLLQRLFNSSTGLRVLRDCPCPVWLAGPGSPRRISSILVAVDHTDAGQWALDAGISLSEYYGSDLHVLHSFGSSQSNLKNQSLDQSSEISRMIADRLMSADLKGKVHISKSLDSPCAAIQRYLNQESIDLVALGSYSCDSRIFSAAEKLYPHLSCSLLTINSMPVDFIAPSRELGDQRPNMVT